MTWQILGRLARDAGIELFLERDNNKQICAAIGKSKIRTFKVATAGLPFYKKRLFLGKKNYRH